MKNLSEYEEELLIKSYNLMMGLAGELDVSAPEFDFQAAISAMSEIRASSSKYFDALKLCEKRRREAENSKNQKTLF